MTDSKPHREPRRRVSRTGVLLSLAFHLIAIGMLAWMAREGFLGQPLKKITVRLIREPLPEKPPVPEKTKVEPTQTQSSQSSEPVPAKPQTSIPAKLPARPIDSTPAVLAPPPVDVPPLIFDEAGTAVQTGGDPTTRYRNYVEFSLRSHWNRPADMADESFVAEIEIDVSPAGQISNPQWKKQSGNAGWDASVLAAIGQTRSLDRPPPAGFPAKIVVRFDVVTAEESIGITAP